VFFGETIYPQTVFGAALTITGVALTMFSPKSFLRFLQKKENGENR
jgi:drug/metabolite transporter (DMT)-like permease